MRLTRRLVLPVALLAVAAWSATPAAAAARTAPATHHPVRFVLHPLDVRGNVVAVNRSGVLVGTTEDNHAFRWDPRTHAVTDLGTLGGYNSQANAINSRGEIVGSADLPDGRTHAFLWSPWTHTMRDLGTLGGSHSYASAINDRGVVVGWSETTSRRDRAFRWDPRTGRMTALGTFPGERSSQALAINNRGQIAGVSDEHAFLWTPWRRPQLMDLGAGNAVVSVPTGINRYGEVVGFTNDVGDFTDRAVYWDPWRHRIHPVRGLPDVWSHAEAVNDRGMISGSYASNSESNNSDVAFVWDPQTRRPTILPTVENEEGSATFAILDNRTVYGYSGGTVIWTPCRSGRR